MKRIPAMKIFLLLIFINVTFTVAVLAQSDNGATTFQQKCAACHSIGSGPKVGPDLVVVKNWDKASLEKNIIRMQSKAGTLSQSEINGLIQYLQASSSNVPNSKNPNNGITLPGNASMPGAGLYSGSLPFKNGGPACMTCHSMNGGGEAPPLYKIARKGYKCAYSTFLIYPHNRAMANAYGNNPITPNEARQIGAYLNSIQPNSFTQFYQGNGHGHGFFSRFGGGDDGGGSDDD